MTDGREPDMNRILVLKMATAGMVALEVAMVALTEFWPAALSMAVVFAVALWRLTSPHPGATVLAVLVAAFLLELIPLPFYARESQVDWITQGLAGVLSTVGLYAAGALLLTRGRTDEDSEPARQRILS